MWCNCECYQGGQELVAGRILPASRLAFKPPWAHACCLPGKFCDGCAHVAQLVRVDLFGCVCPRRSYGTPQGVDCLCQRVSQRVLDGGLQELCPFRVVPPGRCLGPAHCLGFCPRRPRVAPRQAGGCPQHTTHWVRMCSPITDSNAFFWMAYFCSYCEGSVPELLLGCDMSLCAPYGATRLRAYLSVRCIRTAW